VATIVPAGQFSGARELPDLRGLSAREALRVLTRLGVGARVMGNGIVAAQIPPAGSPMDPGAICELRLERAPLAAASVSAERAESTTR